MKKHNMLPFRGLGLGILLLGMAAAQGNKQQYCSGENTGSDYSPLLDIYNSNGLCADHCRSQYAYAVVQFQSCWCSNITPGDTTSTGRCNQDCPGYPQEQCGDGDSGLYGYIALERTPSGTAGASTPTSSAKPQSPTAAPSSTQEPETSYVSITVTQSATVSVAVTPTPSSTTSTTPSSTSSTSSETSTPETSVQPVTSVIIVTSAGAVVTQTITSTPVAAPEANEGQQRFSRSDRLSGGAIAGIVIGILVALAALAIGAFLLWRRRKQALDGEDGEASRGKNLGRNVSVLSKAGLLNRTRQSMGEKDHDDHFYINPATGQSSVRHSLMFAPGAADGISPVSPLGSSHGSDQSRRMSRPMVYDQRLNPSALFANQEANGSRISMQDTQDYSRPLGIANPDPRPSFESRVSRA